MMISNTIKTIFLFLVVISLMILSCTPKQQNEHLVKSTIQKWENDAWVDSVQTLYFYDSKGYLTTQKKSLLSDSLWVEEELLDITYDASKLRSFEILQVFEGGSYIDSGKLLYDYNNELLMTSNGYDWQDTIWVEIAHTDYTYYTDGKLSRRLLSLKPPGENEWEHNQRLNYYYNDDYIVKMVTEYWENDKWETYFIHEIEYENSKFSKIIFSEYEVDVPRVVEIYLKYDEKGRETEIISYLNVNDSLSQVLRSNKEYSNDFVNLIIDQKWKNESWINSTRTIFEYENCEYLPEDLEVMFKSGLIIERYFGYDIYNHCKVFAKFIH